MQKLIFIVNLHAGNGRCRRIWYEIMRELKKRDISYQKFYTKYKNHARQLTIEIGEKYKSDCIIVAVGGDGTVHEVINGAVSYPFVSIGFIPAGSGNDYCLGFQIPKDPKQALEFLLTRLNDLPVLFDIGQYNNDRKGWFINNLGVGFDAIVTRTANHSRLKKWLNFGKLGKLSYVIFLLKELFFYKPTSVDLLIDGKLFSFDKVWMITFSNQPYYGGGMKISPNASPKNGQLDVTVVQDLSKWKFLLMFTSVFKGSHIFFKEVHTFQGKDCKVESAVPLLVHADGEIIGHTPLELHVEHSKISLISSWSLKEERMEREVSSG